MRRAKEREELAQSKHWYLVRLGADRFRGALDRLKRQNPFLLQLPIVKRATHEDSAES